MTQGAQKDPGASPGDAGNGGVPLSAVEGTVERIVFVNPDNDYTVATLKPASGKEEVTIVGNLVGIQPQEVIRVEGQHIFDRKYGRQFRVERYTPILPSTSVGIEKYLGSGLIKGIGRTYARRLVAHFGTTIFDVIEYEHARLGEVAGIGPKRIAMIRRGWDEHRAVREILVFLQQYGIAQGHAGRIFRQYGDKAIEQIRKNPYQLALDIRGIGFKTADTVAQKLGIPVESIERCKAGVYYLLQELAADGHCLYPADPLIEKAVETLGVEPQRIVEAINALKTENHVVLEILPDNTRAVYLAHLHRNECNVAELLIRVLNTGKLFVKLDPGQEIASFESQSGLRLADNQRLAVKQALHGGVLVITGGPGTGKTTIIRAILRILAKAGISTLLAAPTGRAAKRMQELTRVPAATIHRLLQFSPQEGKYLRNPQNPLKCDFVILDEASMIDIALANSLLRAVSPTTSVVFVGDVDQLPSVGPGNFLQDMIASGVVPVVRLNEVFRQASRSLIVTNAHAVNEGRQPSLPPPDTQGGADFCFLEMEEPEQALEAIKQLVVSRVPAKFGFRPQTDIQVITPMHRGVIGAANLNRELQQLLNPGPPGLDRGGMALRAGDKVMQTANDYDKDVFNGDIGFVASIDREERILRVNFDGRIVSYDFNELEDLELAYAITVHKSQGSEYPAVVIPVHTTHFVMLQRKLLYTGITRGKKLVCLVGQRKAVGLAVRNASTNPRFSALGLRLAQLRKGCASPNPL